MPADVAGVSAPAPALIDGLAALSRADISLLYQDDAILVLNKPAGLLSVPGRGPDKQDCLSSRVAHQFPDARVVHRLDMATSGLLVMARTSIAQQRLNAAFSARQVHKRYVATVYGNCSEGETPQWHTIDLPILVDWPRRPLRKIDPEHGKPSTTRWRCIAFDAATNRSRLELEPLTGRSHQLRVHMLATGHPIVGDTLYAPPDVAAMGARLMLHASALAFAHPHSAAPMRFDCPCPF